MAKIKPFAQPGFTMFHNYVIDHLMRELGPNAWKVLTVAIRQTIGWVDPETDSGRKEKDRISYSQFMEVTGIGSKSTLSKAIQECLAIGYLLRDPAANHAQGYTYRLNVDYEIEIEKTSTETVPAGKKSPKTSTETVPVGEKSPKTSTETVPETGTETVHTKERLNKGKNPKKTAPSEIYVTPLGLTVEIQHG